MFGGSELQSLILAPCVEKGQQAGMPASAPSADGPQIASGAANLSEAQIASVCLSYRHDFGLLPPVERKRIMFTAREWEHAFAKEHAWAELEARPRASRVPRVLEDAARLEQIADAIRDYHYALDTRQHAGIAITSAFETISTAMGMSWAQGIEATRRAAMAAKADSVPEQN